MRHNDTDTDLLQQINDMLQLSNPSTHIMPDYIGQPPFLDTKTELLYQLYLKLRDGGGGGGTDNFKHYRYYELSQIKPPGQEWEAFLLEPINMFALSSLPGTSWTALPVACRITLKINISTGEFIKLPTHLQSTGALERRNLESNWIYQQHFSHVRYADQAEGVPGQLFYCAPFTLVGTDVMLALDYQVAQNIKQQYLDAYNRILNDEAVQLRWGIELQPPPPVT
jgi:hypothetical protein